MYLNNLYSLVQALKVHKHWNAIPCFLNRFQSLSWLYLILSQRRLGEEVIHFDFPNFVSKPAKACPQLQQVSGLPGRWFASLLLQGDLLQFLREKVLLLRVSILDIYHPCSLPIQFTLALQKMADGSEIQDRDFHTETHTWLLHLPLLQEEKPFVCNLVSPLTGFLIDCLIYILVRHLPNNYSPRT